VEYGKGANRSTEATISLIRLKIERKLALTAGHNVIHEVSISPKMYDLEERFEVL